MNGFLGELTDGERADLERRARVKRWQQGEVLFHEGDTSTWVAILLSGRVKASSHGENGAEAILAVREPGALIGEVAAIDRRPRSASVTSLEPAEALVLTAEEFMGFLGDHGQVSLLIMRMLCDRWRDADRKRVEFGLYDTTSRVAQRLVELAERFGEPYTGTPGGSARTGTGTGAGHGSGGTGTGGGAVPRPRSGSDPEGSGVQITLPLSQEELAGWIGASREAVSKALRTLRRQGWIQTGRRSVIVHDLPALKRRGSR